MVHRPMPPGTTRFTMPTRKLGKKMNSSSDSPTPKRTDTVSIIFISFSSDTWLLSHCSNFPGGSLSSSSIPETSAEYISAFTPLYIDMTKV